MQQAPLKRRYNFTRLYGAITQKTAIFMLATVRTSNPTICVYSENHTKPITKPCGQNADLLNVKAGATYSYHCALKC
jgi:hypothetical protein